MSVESVGEDRVNLLGLDKDYLVKRLSEGVVSGHVMLGGRYLPDLRRHGLMPEPGDGEARKVAGSAN